MNLSLGVLETRGMTVALRAADEMQKAAYIEVTGIELTGSGYVAVLFSGDLSAVNAAFDTGVRIAENSGELIAAKVIARPVPELNRYLYKKTP